MRRDCPTPRRPILAGPGRFRLSRFRRDEDGSMVIFGLFLFVMMLITAGMAVDIMRFESTRARLQATLDRAVLAAADLDQTRDAETVVRDYFNAADMLDNLTSVTVTQNFNSKRVDAAAAFEMPTFFMDMLGVDSLEAPADGAAAEAINDIEVMLVLDVSGSMVNNGSTRLSNLQTAAREFVQTVLQNDTQNRISIGIVPFNGQVMVGSPTGTGLPGTVLRDRYSGITDLTNNAWAYCVDLPTAAYSSVTLSRTLAMPATTYANTWDFPLNVTDSNGDQIADSVPNAYTAWSDASNTITNRRYNMWCPPVDSGGTSTAGNVVRLPSHSITGLQSAISGLRGVGATSINAGMRWGMALLDPAMQPMYDQLIAAGAIASNYDDRPYDWNRENTLKVIVLMTDGENFPEERVNLNLMPGRTGFRSGVSPIYKNTTSSSDGNYSIFHASKVDSTSSTTICNSRPFWVPHLAQWHVRPWNGSSTGVTSGCYSATATYTGVTQQTWQAVWAAQRMGWVAQQLYARALRLSNDTTPTSVLAGFRTQMDLFRTRTGTITSSTDDTTLMDSQLASMCTQARTNGVVVYGIAFEAPTKGQQAIFGCSSSPSHYYNAQGLQIQSAFRAIASQINALRLLN